MATTKSKTTSPKWGEEIVLTDTVWEGRWVVPAFCPEPAPAGQWYCLTHNEAFANNIETDGHCTEPGAHKLVWLCFEHGPETAGE